MSYDDYDEDTATLTTEERLLSYAERQAKATETIRLVLEVFLFLFILSALIGGIALLGA